MKPFLQALISICLVVMYTQVHAQSITNVRARPEGKQVIIQYDLTGPATESYTISVFISEDNATWLGPLNTVSGAVGTGIRPGVGKKIVWQPLSDYDYIKGNIRFKVKAKGNGEAPPPKPITTNAIEPDMVFVQGGNFIMGSKKDEPNGQDDEKPRREVQVSSFYMGKYEVTYGEFKTFVNETNYKTDAEKGDGSFISTGSTWTKKPGVNWRHDAQGVARDIDEKRHPVIHVSWNDAQAYIRWLNQNTGKSYRLPTEAEWEYAAKGGAKGQGYLYSGSNSIGLVAWYNENSGNKTHPVGQKQANELGIFDMTGNVCEWCQDWYDASYYAGRPELDVDPQGAASTQMRVYRGGHFGHSSAFCHVARRRGYGPGLRDGYLGFRLVLPSR